MKMEKGDLWKVFQECGEEGEKIVMERVNPSMVYCKNFHKYHILHPVTQ
jgi:hypothetical protein